MMLHTLCGLCNEIHDTLQDSATCVGCGIVICSSCRPHECRGKVPKPVINWDERQAFIRGLRRIMNVR